MATAALLVLGVLAASTRDSASSSSAPAPASAVSHRPELLHLAAAGRQMALELAAAPAAPAAGDAVIAPAPAEFDAPPAPPAPPPAVLQQVSPPEGAARGTGTWAVIVGINDYPGGSGDLRSAVNDANDMDQALAVMGVPAHQRLVIRDRQATGGVMRAAVDWLVAHAGPDAVAVFFFSGHVRKLEPTREALIAADGNLLSDEELGARLSRLQARRAWIAIAGCYGGGFVEVLAPGRVLTGAAGADSLAYESSLFWRSYMVQYMVREAMIEGRASDSVQAAFAYAHAELAREHPGRQPVQIDSGSGPLDLRPHSGPRAARAAPATPSQPPPPQAPPPAPPPSTPPTTTCFLIFCSQAPQ